MADEDFARELHTIYSDLKTFNTEMTANIQSSLDALTEAVTAAGRAWSGSWLGYHAHVYYGNLEVPPPGAHFSAEWGLEHRPITIPGTRGDWQQYNPDAVKGAIFQRAGTDTQKSIEAAQHAESVFEEKRDTLVSLLHAAVAAHPDLYLQKILNDAEQLRIVTAAEILHRFQPQQVMSRDMTAMSQGYWTPPHLEILSQVSAIEGTFDTSTRLEKMALSASSYLERMERTRTRKDRIGTNVFIGHGRSSAWRDLKDFVQDRLHLPFDEFNRVPVAGVTNIARLAEMLDAAAIAFIVMTGEDEQVDGRLHARMNVIHEAGLFQGRLGFTKAIVLLEDGCEEFSNIQGLGQIRFPKGNIKAAFEEIRQILEREALV